MMGRTLHPLLQRLLALILLGVALGAAASSIAMPVVEALGERDAAFARLARYQRALASPTAASLSQNPDDLAAQRLDEASAQLALQASVDRIARGAGLAIQSVQPQAAEHLGEIGRGAWLDLSFTSDLKALSDFMVSLDAERPLLLVRRLEVDRGDGPRADLFLRVRVEIGQAWRASGGPA
jgi:Type II secretion system (T2SS), protein M subtype b